MTFREKRKRQTFTTLDLIARSYETKFVAFALRQKENAPKNYNSQ